MPATFPTTAPQPLAYGARKPLNSTFALQMVINVVAQFHGPIGVPTIRVIEDSGSLCEILLPGVADLHPWSGCGQGSCRIAAKVRAASARGLAPPGGPRKSNSRPGSVRPKASTQCRRDLPPTWRQWMFADGGSSASTPGNFIALRRLADQRRRGYCLAALAAASRGSGVICPAGCGGEAAWAGEIEVIAAPSLLAIVNHFKGTQLLPHRSRVLPPRAAAAADLQDVKGQESAKRALEIAAAGGHNLLMVGPPGSGEVDAGRTAPGILPPLEPAEALELGMIRSVAGGLRSGEAVA